MNPQEALAALDATSNSKVPSVFDSVACMVGTSTTGTVANRSYASLKPADALSHLNETITAEVERFEHDVGLRLVSVKVTRCKEDDVLKTVQAHVR